MPAVVVVASRALAAWSPRRWLAAALAATLVLLALAVPTALIATPWFGREIPPTWWAWPVAVATAAMSGLLLATYVDVDRRIATAGVDAKRAGVGGLLSFFAVGCPVCNKLVLAALGTTGALNWFAPVQPLLAVAALALVSWALARRLAGEVRCRL
ncbi:hypothetical protein [Conexibacter arvalis]|uniref:Uncharacterized protein n=1 Tax=Conexibacter arvalis TaxID=912552 RepID=A0A840IIB9_9ACTN|nr:hypothetical protein [Conexibacter arvalis]MBB4664519.1 hypothetical protein [Conexibacter arvalis]